MKYIVFTYNILTLCRAIKYTEKQWGKENTKIIYTDLVSPLPEQFKKDYNITFLSSNNLDKLRGIHAIVESCQHAKSAWRLVDNFIKEDIEKKYTLVIFRDNEVQESTIIQKVKKRYKNQIEVWLIEEGSGLYALDKVPIRYRLLKKIIFNLFNVSLYSLKNLTQGMNPNVDKIICTDINDIISQKNKLAFKEKMIDIFTEDFNSYIVNSVIGDKYKESNFDYVFLTQPFTDFRANYNEVLQSHEDLLPLIFEVLSKRGKTLIKLHPREQYDYSQYAGENVILLDSKDLPFECMMQMYSYPQMISMYSSASINIKTQKPSIYLFKLFNIPGTEKLFPTDYFTKNNIILCNNIEEFSKALL